jgi:galactose mutarotase-like enzyme
MKLNNGRMQIEIADLGAELMHIQDTKYDRELLWNGDAAYWKRRSPVLFPNVGKTYGNVMRINGKEYPTSQHGFARDMIFIPEESGEDFAQYLLEAGDATKLRYPGEFALRIRYEIRENVLKVIWKVENHGSETMPFTIGGHPAFCFGENETKADYKLFFPGMKSLRYISLDAASGTAMPEAVQEIALQDGYLPLSDELFAHDALILDNNQVKEAWLCTQSGEARIGMKSAAFPNYGIWSVQGAPFVCLEPWQGRCDTCGFSGDYGEKENAVVLAAGETFEIAYEIVLPE